MAPAKSFVECKLFRPATTFLVLVRNERLAVVQVSGLGVFVRAALEAIFADEVRFGRFGAQDHLIDVVHGTPPDSRPRSRRPHSRLHPAQNLA